MQSAAQGFVRSPVGTTVSVPDGGATCTLLGVALLGLIALRRTLTA
jgi:hypothetical protein